MSNTSAFVPASWLAEKLHDPKVRVVDASFYLPTQNRDAKAEYLERHLPGAVFFDVDEIADRSSPLPHMMPSTSQFERQVGELGIGTGDTVVVYDAERFLASARVWWMFRMAGHVDVHVLDGGLQAWISAGLPLEAGPVAPQPRAYQAEAGPSLLADRRIVQDNLQTQRAQVVDARSAGRFHATEPEPRVGLRGGHVPGSVNLPFGDLIDSDGRLKPIAQLAARLGQSGLDLARPIIATCGSGVSAAVIALAAYEVGKDDVSVYDGSWSEWGALADVPIEA